MLARLVQDLHSLSTHAEAVPALVIMPSDNAVAEIWVPSSGLFANDARVSFNTSEPELSSNVSSSFQLAKSQNIPETCLKEYLPCELSPLGYYLSL